MDAGRAQPDEVRWLVVICQRHSKIPKLAKDTQEGVSSLHDWVMDLPFQMQALLMTCMRGPDGMDKHVPAKAIIRYLRGTICKPAGDWNGKNNNDFMWGEYRFFNAYAVRFWEDHDSYPHHFIMHLVHCAEVIAYCYPDKEISNHWWEFYVSACKSFHMVPEARLDMHERLNDFGCGVHSQEKINLES